MNEGCWVYILASRRNGTLYVGVTTELGPRIYAHRNGLVDGFTRKYGVTMLVYLERYDSIIEARARELVLKKWRRAWKVALVERDNPVWRDLYEDILK